MLTQLLMWDRLLMLPVNQPEFRGIMLIVTLTYMLQVLLMHPMVTYT